jgi:hypothetical protein
MRKAIANLAVSGGVVGKSIREYRYARLLANLAVSGGVGCKYTY